MKELRNTIQQFQHALKVDEAKETEDVLKQPTNEPASKGEDAREGSNCTCPGFYGILDGQDWYGSTPLALALRVSRDPPIPIVHELLHYSASGVNQPIIKISLRRNDDDVQDGRATTWERPLYSAVANNVPLVLRMLISRGVDVNMVDSMGYSPLSLVIHRESKEMTEILLRSGANFGQTCPNHPHMSLLAEAIQSMSPNVLDSINLYDPLNDVATPREKCIVKEAISKRRWDIINLIDRITSDKVNLGKALDEIGAVRTVILARQEASVIEWLLQKGANASARHPFLPQDDHQFWNLPIQATAIMGNVPIAKNLIEHGGLLSQDSHHDIPLIQVMAYVTDQVTARWFFSETMNCMQELPSANKYAILRIYWAWHLIPGL